MNKKEVFILFAILISSVFIYLPAQKGVFLYDSEAHIRANSKIHSPQSVSDVVFNGLRQRRIIMNLSFGLNGYLSGLNITALKF